MKKLIFLSLFLIFSCSSDNESDNSCTPIACLNGGTQTTDCGCDCSDGYIGSDCSTRLIPISVKITNITVKKFPNLDNGNLWDALSDADITFTIESPSDIEIYEEPTYYNDASGLNVSYPFTLDPALTIYNVTENHTLYLFDYDDLSLDDIMAGLVFKPYDSSREGFPTSFTISNNANTFECDFTVEYTW